MTNFFFLHQCGGTWRKPMHPLSHYLPTTLELTPSSTKLARNSHLSSPISPLSPSLWAHLCCLLDTEYNVFCRLSWLDLFNFYSTAPRDVGRKGSLTNRKKDIIECEENKWKKWAVDSKKNGKQACRQRDCEADRKVDCKAQTVRKRNVCCRQVKVLRKVKPTQQT